MPQSSPKPSSRAPASTGGLLYYRIYDGERLDGRVVRRPYALPRTFETVLAARPGWTIAPRGVLADYSDLSRFSLVKRYIDGTDFITDKTKIMKIDRPFIPPTAYVASPKHVEAAFRQICDTKQRDFDAEIFVLKNVRFDVGQGLGVNVVRSVEDVLRIFETDARVIAERGGRIRVRDMSGGTDTFIKRPAYVLQRAVRVAEGARKSDYRFFVLLVRAPGSLTAHTYRTMIRRYARENASSEHFAFITNTAAIAYDTSLSEDDRARELAHSTRIVSDTDEPKLNSDFRCISNILAHIVAPHTHVDGNRGFLVLGLDFIIAPSGRSYFLEANFGPAFYDVGDWRHSAIHRGFEVDLVRGVVELAIEPLACGEPPPKKSAAQWNFLTHIDL